MNFITKLFLFKDYNAICIIIYYFIKKRYYVFCY